MESCFPPLVALSLRSGSGDNIGDKSHKTKRYSSTSASNNASNQSNLITNQKDGLQKLEILQDLDLYYIRQIASSLKV